MLKKSTITLFILTLLFSAINIILIQDYFMFQFFWGISQILINILIFFIGVLIIPYPTKFLLARIFPDKKPNKSKISTVSRLLFALFFPLWIGMNLYLLPEWKSVASLICNLLLFISIVLFLFHFSGLKKIKRVLLAPPMILLTALLFLVNFHSTQPKQTALNVNTDDTQPNALISLPYFSWSIQKASADQSGVMINQQENTSKGLNIYTSEAGEVFLINMEGEIVHQWHLPAVEDRWEYATVLENGDLIAVCYSKCIVKLNKDSKVIWLRYLPAHHDIEILENGHIMVPILLPKTMHYMRRMDFDAIVTLNEKGEFIDYWSVLENLNELKSYHKPRYWLEEIYSLKKLYHLSYRLFETLYFSTHGHNIIQKSTQQFIKNQINASHPASETWMAKTDRSLFKLFHIERTEYHHLNTIKRLPENPLEEQDPRFTKGNLLICMRNSNLILILDPNTWEVLWHYGPDELDWPHMPTMLKNGHILIFDNRFHSNWSRVIEIDPVSKKIVWEYQANPPESFYSPYRGSAQRLPNGNTLICDAQNGRAFEVMPKGNMVWEFFNPDIVNERRRIIYRFLRITDEGALSFIQE